MPEDALTEATNRLETRGHRATPQRAAVIAALLAQRRYVTAQDLHTALRRMQPHLGLATVYRTLELLVESGLAEAFPQSNNEMRYAFCSARHHHHLVCRRCGLVAEATGCSLTAIEEELGRQNQFAITDHALTFFGVCNECAATEGEPTASMAS